MHPCTVHSPLVDIRKLLTHQLEVHCLVCFQYKGHPASANTSGLKTQLAISIALGLGSFLAFCALRTRWPIIFAPRTKLRRHTPPRLSPKFFEWIKELLTIDESVVLDCVGLDAAMMLRFFAVSAQLFAICMIPGILIILPVNNYSTFDGRLPTDPDDGNDPSDPSLPGTEPRPGTSLLYLFTQFTFAWLFSLLTIYHLWHTYEGYIKVRREYLLKRHKAIVNRTVMVVGLPVHLQSDRALATFYESLQVGTVESAHIGRHVRKLKRLIEQRAHALKALELAYARYYGNPSRRADYDPDAIAAENDKCLEHHHHHHSGTATAATAAAVSLGENPSQETNHGNLPGSDEGPSIVPRTGRFKERPTMRLGFMGIFGKKVDKIDHYREVFATLDKAVQKMRMSRVYAATSIGFVTFEDMQSAQILAQTVNTEETLTCETFLAPEPRDVYWDNLNLPPGEIAVRTVVVNVICFFLVFFWAGPVSVFSSFLNLDSLNKIFPGISRLAGKNRILKSLIQGFLPTVGVIIFLTVVPKILLSLCRRQGMQSHSEIEQSLYNKYFTFILFNVVLVFTIVGTWAQAFDKVYHNLGELTLILAASLPRVAPFFVNYTILRGIGLFPLQLLQIGDVFGQVFQGFVSRTPRDYAEARAPPELPYGVVYSNATLVFVVILIYSCIKPLILVFGALYFAIGILVFKYQVLYVYFHPHESSGQMWPMVYNRLTLGLVTFQLTMLGLFMLKQAYVFGVLLAPLPIGTVWFWYWTTATYKQTAKFVPLQQLRPDDDMVPVGAQHPQVTGHGSPLDNGTLVAADSGGLQSVHGHKKDLMQLDQGGHGNPESNRSSATTMEVASNLVVPPSLPAAVITPGGTRRRMPKSVVDEDDYQAIPDRYTDYRQPPMSFYFGVLNSGMRHYAHPALSGPLPTLWLPLQKGEKSLGSVGKRAKRSHLGDEEARAEGHEWPPSTMIPALDPDQPQTYDEGDNLAGGGQDEEDAEGSEIADDTQDQDGPQMEVQGSTLAMDIPNDSSSNVTGGPSFPEMSLDENVRPTSSSRNSAVEGINDVYYHHPERRLSNAGSTRRRGTVGSEAGGGGSGSFPPRSLPGRGPRLDLLRDQGLSGSGPPASAPPNVRRS
ncbi:hypothetical protein KVV02_004715 [Mortierella alpina]|uniref:DUF221-domain-containing protein n=1 Tax=Mortierella alpina TaxID=64518 RepID=A0A9P8CX81_MORAP|nr:hypothetical protein KVV02_004715 [Mortierella alpina]